MSTQNLLVSILALALIGLAGWFLLAGDTPSGDDPLSTGTGLEGASGFELEGRGVVSDQPERDAIEAVPFRSNEDRALSSMVWGIEVRHPNGAPAAGAKVKAWAARQGSSERISYSFRGANGPWSVMKRAPMLEGTTLRGGVFPLEMVPPTPLVVMAESGGLTALVQTQQPKEGEPIVLTLSEPRDVAVTVVDQLGAPVVGARVLASADPNAVAANPSTFTGEDGVARMRLDARQSAVLEQEGFLPVALKAGGGAVTGPSVPWAESGVTEARIELEQAVGVDVVVTDAQNRPVPGAYVVSFRKKMDPASSRFDFGALQFKHERAFTGSTTRVAGFASGGSYTFTLSAPGHLKSEATVTIDETSLTQELRIPLGALAPVVELTFLDDQGQPLANEKLELRLKPVKKEAPPTAEGVFTSSRMLIGGLQPDEGDENENADPTSTRTRRVTTDDEGRIALRTGIDTEYDLFVYRPRRGASSFVVVFGDMANQNREAIHTAPIPPLGPGARLALDPITVPALPLLVAGRVVDGAGRGIAGATVRVYEPRKPGQAPNLNGRFSINGIAESETLVGLRVTTDADGRYELRAEGDPADLVVRAELGRANSMAVPIPVGSTDLELAILRPGAIAGTITTTLPNHPTVRISAAPSDGGVESSPFDMGPRLETQSGSDGSFTLDELTPGRWDVYVRISGMTVAEVPGVEVLEAEVTRDPRLANLQVGSELREVWVRIEDPDGQPIHKARVSFTLDSPARESARRVSGRTDESGQYDFLARIDARADVEVKARGFVNLKQENVPLNTTLTMTRGARLTIEMPGLADFGRELDKGSFRVRLAPKRKGGDQADAAERLREVLGGSLPTGSRTITINGSSTPSDGSTLIPSLVDMSGPGTRTKTVNRGQETVVFDGVAPGEYTATIELSNNQVFRATSGGGLGGTFVVASELSTSSTRTERVELGEIAIVEKQREALIRYAPTPEDFEKLTPKD